MLTSWQHSHLTETMNDKTARVVFKRRVVVLFKAEPVKYRVLLVLTFAGVVAMFAQLLHCKNVRMLY